MKNTIKKIYLFIFSVYLCTSFSYSMEIRGAIYKGTNCNESYTNIDESIFIKISDAYKDVKVTPTGEFIFLLDENLASVYLEVWIKNGVQKKRIFNNMVSIYGDGSMKICIPNLVLNIIISSNLELQGCKKLPHLLEIRDKGILIFKDTITDLEYTKSFPSELVDKNYSIKFNFSNNFMVIDTVFNWINSDKVTVEIPIIVNPAINIRNSVDILEEEILNISANSHSLNLKNTFFQRKFYEYIFLSYYDINLQIKKENYGYATNRTNLLYGNIDDLVIPNIKSSIEKTWLETEQIRKDNNISNNVAIHNIDLRKQYPQLNRNYERLLLLHKILMDMLICSGKGFIDPNNYFFEQAYKNLKIYEN